MNGLPYEKNWIETVYYQDCGGNSLSFVAVDASCDATAFLTAGEETGVNSLNSHTFAE